MKNIVIANAPELERALATKIYCELIIGGIILAAVVIFGLAYLIAWRNK